MQSSEASFCWVRANSTAASDHLVIWGEAVSGLIIELLGDRFQVLGGTLSALTGFEDFAL